MNPIATSPRSVPFRNRQVALLAAGIGCVIVLASCGTSSKSPAAATPTSPASTSSASAAPTTTTGSGAGGGGGQAAQAYRTCLSQHGVTLPTRPPTSAGQVAGGGGGGGFGGGLGGGLQAVMADPANKVAVDACASLVPAGGFGQGGAGSAARAQARQAYNSCLADNGVDVPTTIASGPPPSIDRTTPAFAAANAKCQALLPQSSSTSSTPSSSVAG